MERIAELAVQRLVGSSGLSERGTGLRLSDEQSEQLTILCRQMQAYYPHQEFLDETVEGYQFDLERLSAMYGLARVRQVLLDIRIKPGQKWFPHPSEVSEALEEMVKQEKLQERKDNPFIPCGRCSSGMVISERDGRRFASRCHCWLAWKNGQPEIDGKQKGSGV